MAELTGTECQALREELARAAIRQAMLRYCRGVDRADEALFLSAFHPNAQEKHGRYEGPAEDFARITCQKIGQVSIGIQHVLGNCLIELDGPVAKVETYFTATYRAKADPDVLAQFGGRYLDRFEERSGEWRIVRRTVVNDWSSRTAVPADDQGTQGYLAASSGQDDPLFATSTWAPLAH